MRAETFSQKDLEALHARMESYVQRGERPGLVAALSRNGERHIDPVGTQAFGSARPMERGTIFRIASITKPVVAAAAMALVEEGRFRLNEPIDRLVPELRDRRVLRRLDGALDDTVPAKRPILVRDLLTMTMGMGAIMVPGSYPILDALAERGLFTPFQMPRQSSADEWLALLADLPLMDQPGEVWRYDTSITLLGALIERATKQSLEDVLSERIFQPVGMKDTSFAVPPEKLHRLAVAYQKNSKTGALEVWDPSGPESFFAKLPGFAGAHGGLVSTADDYLAFAQMLLEGGRVQGRAIISPALVAEMTSDQVPGDVKARSAFVPGFWERHGWGYGLSVVTRDVPGDGRGCGWDGGYGTSAYWDAKTGAIAVLLSQRLVDGPGFEAIRHDFFGAAYAAMRL
jgi:CubicO group peptidase (beta-lactamase class C family)